MVMQVLVMQPCAKLSKDIGDCFPLVPKLPIDNHTKEP